MQFTALMQYIAIAANCAAIVVNIAVGVYVWREIKKLERK